MKLFLLLVLLSGSILASSVGQFSFNNPTGISVHGTNTNDSAPSGYIGEFIQAKVTSFTNVPETTGQWGDLTSISLTAGDWDVTGCAQFSKNGATLTQLNLGVSITSGNSTTGLIEGDNWLGDASLPSVSVNQGLCILTYRVSLSSTTTVYLKNTAGFSIATPQYQCRLSARRIR